MNLLGTHAKNGPRPDCREALLDSLVKLNPLYLWKDSPVMLVVEAGFALVLAMGFAPRTFAGLVNQSRWFYFVIAGILVIGGTKVATDSILITIVAEAGKS